MRTRISKHVDFAWECPICLLFHFHFCFHFRFHSASIPLPPPIFPHIRNFPLQKLGLFCVTFLSRDWFPPNKKIIHFRLKMTIKGGGGLELIWSTACNYLKKSTENISAGSKSGKIQYGIGIGSYKPPWLYLIFDRKNVEKNAEKIRKWKRKW